MEDRWQAEHDDLPAQVFLSCGEAEGADPSMVMTQCLSTSAMVAERPVGRKYPSLDLTLRIFPNEGHVLVMPVAYCTGDRHLWCVA